MLKTLFLTLFLFSGCSFFKPAPDLIDISQTYEDMKRDHEKVLVKMRAPGFYLTGRSPGVEHSLIWFYGPDVSLSKADVELYTDINRSIMTPGFGLKNNLEITFQSLFNIKSLDIKSNQLGFKTFSDLFEYEYSQITSMNKNAFLNYVEKLESRGLITKKEILSLSPKDLKDKYFELFSFYKLEPTPVIINSKNFIIEDSDFSAYYFTMYILSKKLRAI